MAEASETRGPGASADRVPRPVPTAWRAMPPVLALLAWACAEPMLPTGGPTDRTPPAIVSSFPENETVLFEGDAVRLVFSEYVDQASFARAFSVAPPFEGQLRFRWRKRRVDISFPEALRPNTTFVITIDTDLRDAHGVPLTAPISLAFATGAVIDQGRLTGRVVEPHAGLAAAGYDVLAYLQEDDSSEAAAYRTQTDEEGRFSLAYLRDGEYRVVVLGDRNRNLQPDANEAFAVSPVETLHTTEDTTRSDMQWVITRLDTLAPAVDRARLQSAGLLQVRFSESVVLQHREPERWTLSDSASGQRFTVRQVFQIEDDPRSVFLSADVPAGRSLALAADPSIADSSGNSLNLEAVHFSSGTEQEAAALTLLRFLPSESESEVILASGAAPGLLFSEPPGAAKLPQLVTAMDSSGEKRAFQTLTRDGTSYLLQFEPGLAPGERVHIHVEIGDSLYVQQFALPSTRDLGSLSGAVGRVAQDSPVVVEAYEAGTKGRPLATTLADSSGAFSLTRLAEGAYDLRLYADLNGNGRWDGGSIQPYRSAEPITWTTEPAMVRARWDSALADTLAFAPQ